MVFLSWLVTQKRLPISVFSYHIELHTVYSWGIFDNSRLSIGKHSRHLL